MTLWTDDTWETYPVCAACKRGQHKQCPAFLSKGDIQLVACGCEDCEVHHDGQ